MQDHHLRIGLAACLFCTAAVAFGQDCQESTTKDLLNEVRRLRVALEQSAIAVPRIQLALQRMQIQQSRVDRVSTRPRDLRSKMDGASTERTRQQVFIKQMETDVAAEQDSLRRRDLQRNIDMVKQQLESGSAQDDQQRLQEAEIARSLMPNGQDLMGWSGC